MKYLIKWYNEYVRMIAPYIHSFLLCRRSRDTSGRVNNAASTMSVVVSLDTYGLDVRSPLTSSTYTRRTLLSAWDTLPDEKFTLRSLFNSTLATLVAHDARERTRRKWHPLAGRAYPPSGIFRWSCTVHCFSITCLGAHRLNSTVEKVIRSNSAHPTLTRTRETFAERKPARNTRSLLDTSSKWRKIHRLRWSSGMQEALWMPCANWLLSDTRGHLINSSFLP